MRARTFLYLPILQCPINILVSINNSSSLYVLNNLIINLQLISIQSKSMYKSMNSHSIATRNLIGRMFEVSRILSIIRQNQKTFSVIIHLTLKHQSFHFKAYHWSQMRSSNLSQSIKHSRAIYSSVIHSSLYSLRLS